MGNVSYTNQSNSSPLHSSDFLFSCEIVFFKTWTYLTVRDFLLYGLYKLLANHHTNAEDDFGNALINLKHKHGLSQPVTQ